MKDLKCEIISIGTEILLGDIVNTNSQFLTKSLSDIGVSVYYHTSVGDNEERILNSFENAFNRGMNLIITTGGLGPTDDDLTKEISSKYFNKKLVLNQNCLDDLKDRLKKSNSVLTDANLKQAYIPEGCDYIKNNNGTAPGVIINVDEKIIINLPGPPKELVPMFNEYVRPYLQKFSDHIYYSEILRLYGAHEGEINHILCDLFKNSDPSVAPYANDNDLVLRITTSAIDEKHGKEKIGYIKEEIYRRLSKKIYVEGNVKVEEILFNELVRLGYKISFAESCTGGMVSSTFVNLNGASNVFNESFVTYSNESKRDNIGADYNTIKEFGAVSSETAKEMVLGLYNKTGCEVCVSITGVAGPNQSENKPAGLVYIGIKIKDNIVIKRFNFTGNRQRVREKATFNALINTYLMLKDL